MPFDGLIRGDRQGNESLLLLRRRVDERRELRDDAVFFFRGSGLIRFFEAAQLLERVLILHHFVGKGFVLGSVFAIRRLGLGLFGGRLGVLSVERAADGKGRTGERGEKK